MRKLELTAFELAERFIGIKEVAGTVNNPQIMAMLKLDNEWPQNDEVPWCLAGNVEILTKEGFVRLDKYKASSDVACVDPSMRIEFGRPISVITKRHRGKTIKLCNRDFSLVCDDQHRFVGIWNKKNGKDFPLELRPIKDLTSSLFIPRAKTEKEDDYLGWEDRELSLLAAFLSDGFIHHDRISIQVSKNRKVDFLEKLCPIHKYEAKVAYGRSVSPLTTFEFKIPDKFGHIFAGYKEPSSSPARARPTRSCITMG